MKLKLPNKQGSYMTATGLTQKAGLQMTALTFWCRNYYFFFLILAHPVYKIWTIQEPNTLELWNKLYFEEEKTGEYIPCLKYLVPIFFE